MLNHHEARNQSHVFHLRTSSPCARCLTLALAPNGAGPGSHLGFTDVTLGCPLATRAHDGRATTLERLTSNPPLRVVGSLSCARVRHQEKDGRYRGKSIAASSLRSSIRQRQQSGLTERTLARSEPCADAPLVAHRLRFVPSDAVRPDCKLTASALFGPRPMTDSPALHPLHSAVANRFAGYADAIAAFRRPQTGETVTNIQAHPQTPEAAMLRISASTPQYGARLRLSPKTSAIAPRGFARCKTPALTVSTASFRSLRRLRSRIWPTSLTKPNWSDTSPSGCVPCVRPRPCTHRVAALALRSAVEESESLAGAGATAPGHEPADPAKGIGFAAGCHERPARLTVLLRPRLWPRLAPRCYTQHILCVRSARSSLHTFILFAQQLPASRVPSARKKCRTIWRCVTHRCFTVTLTANPHLALVRAVSAPVRRHRARQRSRFTEKEQPGLLAPKPPPIPNARPLPSPSGLRSESVGSLRSVNRVAA